MCFLRLKGTTLTELLVVLLIVASCTFVAHTLIHESLRSLTNSIYQQRAGRLALNLTEWLNLLQTNSYTAAPPARPADCISKRCTGTELLGDRLHYWQLSAKRGLPAGNAQLRFIDTQPRSLEIDVSWTQAGNIKRRSVTRAMLKPTEKKNADSPQNE